MNEYKLNSRCNDIATEIAMRTTRAYRKVFRNDSGRVLQGYNRASDEMWAFIQSHPEDAIDWDEISEVCF
jgi:hypothetical protein